MRKLFHISLLLLFLAGCASQPPAAKLSRSEVSPVANTQIEASSSIQASKAEPRSPLKIAFVYVGPIGDAGWTYQHELARRAIQQTFSDKVSTTYVERVSEFDDGRVFRDLVENGNTLIFATVFGFLKQVEAVATQYPGVKFEQSDGYKATANIRNYAARTYESAYLAGMLAGGTTRSNRLGIVASIPIPEIIGVINAYTLGARSVNPKVVTQVEWVMQWFHPPKEAKAAEKLFKRGVDVMFQTTDSAAVMEVAEAQGKRAIGWDSDMQPFGPNAHLASATVNWAPYYIKSVNDVLNGSWTTGFSWWGLAQGAVDLSNVATDVPFALVKRIDTARQRLKEGSLQVWRGPIWDNAGKLVLSDSSVASDQEIARMAFLVRGVETRLP